MHIIVLDLVGFWMYRTYGESVAGFLAAAAVLTISQVTLQPVHLQPVCQSESSCTRLYVCCVTEHDANVCCA